jgi:methylenetetrahydrofolate dehydrogenase (NADP+)/methenyltetrahydrofolate cyclohydrolase
MRILDGKVASKALLAEIAADVEHAVGQGARPPHLAAVLVGDDGASLTYVNSKVRHCDQVGIRSSLFQLPAHTQQDEVLALVHKLNEDDGVDGFIVQLPLPRHLDERAVVMAIDPRKDVDGFHPQNVGRLTLGMPTFVSATPLGIMEMLRYFHVPTAGRHAVVLGRSNIVGTPMSILLSRGTEPGNCTVTLCHSRTPDIAEHVRRADIIVAAIGKPGFVTADMVKPGAVVIDVGITRVIDPAHPKGYAIRGDVDFDNVAPLCSWITPVPGGVGLMTIVALLRNTMQAYRSSPHHKRSPQTPIPNGKDRYVRNSTEEP